MNFIAKNVKLGERLKGNFILILIMPIIKKRKLEAPIKIEQSTLNKFFPFLPEPETHRLIKQLKQNHTLSNGEDYTLRMKHDGTIYIKEEYCLDCGKRLVKNGHNRRIAVLDKGLGKHELRIHRKRCPQCGEITPDYSKIAPKFRLYHENYRRRVRQHYLSGLMPSQIQRVLKIDLGIFISKTTINRWIEEVAKTLRTTLKKTPIPSSGYWGYDEIHLKVRGKKMYALTTVDTNTRFIPAALVSPSMGSKAGRELFQEAKRGRNMLIKGLVKDCTTNLGALLKKRGYDQIQQQNCKTHVKWIFTRHVKVFAGLTAQTRKKVPRQWRWLLYRFYDVIDAKHETDGYIKLEILRNIVESLREIKPKKYSRLKKAFDQIEKWLPKLIAYNKNPKIASTNNVLEGFHRKFEYYPSFKKNMMTAAGAQRVLDYRVYGHNIKHFPTYIQQYKHRQEMWRALVREDGGDMIFRGQGNHFKFKIRKLNEWYGTYLSVWNQHFSII